MLKLIKLEWKKNRIGKYVRNAVLLALMLCLFVFAFAFLGIVNDPETGVPDAALETGMLSSSIEMLTSMSFLVFTGVMLASFIVGAYQNKTMNLIRLNGRGFWFPRCWQFGFLILQRWRWQSCCFMGVFLLEHVF